VDLEISTYAYHFGFFLQRPEIVSKKRILSRMTGFHFSVLLKLDRGRGVALIAIG